MDKKLVKVWNVNLVNGKKIKAATIEQGPRQPSMCKGCSSPCCKGMFSPVLTEEEFLSRKFDSRFTLVPDWLKEKVPNATHIVTLNVTEKGCPYHKNNICTIFPNCPKSCLSYDCRGDKRLKKFAEAREKTWQEQ